MQQIEMALFSCHVLAGKAAHRRVSRAGEDAAVDHDGTGFAGVVGTDVTDQARHAGSKLRKVMGMYGHCDIHAGDIALSSGNASTARHSKVTARPSSAPRKNLSLIVGV